jgi:hypothetical protein
LVSTAIFNCYLSDVCASADKEFYDDQIPVESVPKA